TWRGSTTSWRSASWKACGHGSTPSRSSAGCDIPRSSPSPREPAKDCSGKAGERGDEVQDVLLPFALEAHAPPELFVLGTRFRRVLPFELFEIDALRRRRRLQGL